MKIVLATGIYPPDIGGPATYVRALAGELTKRGMRVVVVTYGTNETEGTEETDATEERRKGWTVVCVSKRGGPILRWLRYARALRTHAADADLVLAFSLVSCGVPLWWAKLQKPKKILRLGGDFLWERYTDCGGMKGLREFYEGFSFQLLAFRKWLQLLLLQFDHVVFSTQLQKEVYEGYYKSLPPHSVIENALEAKSSQLKAHTHHTPFRLLYLGRFVAFKNIQSLLHAVTKIPEVTLTLVGEGPLLHFLEGNVRGLQLQDRVTFRPKVNGEGRDTLFHEHDLLMIPSVTEISPNTALEARAAGLPILLTEETGLSERLRQGIVVRKLRTPEQICNAIREVMADYKHIAEGAAGDPARRPWSEVAQEYLELFLKLGSLSW